MRNVMRTVLIGTIVSSLGACSSSLTSDQKAQAHIYDLGKGFYTPQDAYLGIPNPSTKAINIALNPNENPAGRWSCHVTHSNLAGTSQAPSYECNWWRN